MNSRIEVIGDATLYLGDCREILPTLSGVAAALFDPPFGIDYRSGRPRGDKLWSGDSIINDETVDARDEAIAALGGLPMLVFGSWKAARPVATRMVLTWDKGPALGMGDLSLPWKPSSEEIYVLGSGFVGARDTGAVIYCPPVQSMASNGRQHPNEKPVDLLVRLLRKLPEGLTCDPFMGSGSTGVACAKLGRAFVGCELDDRYFDIACRRIEAAYRQPRLFSPPKPVQDSMFEPAPKP